MTKKKHFSKNTFKLLYMVIKKVKWDLLFGIVLSLIAVLMGLLSPIILQKIIDVEINPRLGIINANSFTKTMALYFGAILLTNLFRYLKVNQLKIASNKVGYNLREMIYNHALALPLSYHDKTPVGKIAGRVVGDVTEIKELFFVGFDSLFNAFCFLLGSIIYVSTINIYAGIILFLPLPLLYILIKIYNNYASKLNISYRKGRSKITADLNEILNGIPIIRAYGVTDEARQEFNKLNDAQVKQGLKIERFDSFASFNISETLQVLSSILILGICGYNILLGDNTTTVGFMLLLLMYNSNVYNNINNTLRRINVIEKALASIEHVVEFLEVEVETDGSEDFPKVEGSVTFDKVDFEYIEDTPVIKNVSFEAKEGSSTAIVGNTGSGKSSLMNLIFRFYHAKKGKIEIDGKDIENFKMQDLRKNMALVLQDPFIFRTSLRENITMGRNYSDSQVIEAIKVAGGEHILKRLPEGIDTEFKGNTASLSLGEKQIISFARTIIRNPKILVLDEATASIDSETEKYIQEGLKNVMQGRTSFIIAHRLSTIKNCDQIIVLDKGEILEIGTHETLMEKKGKYYDLITKQIK